MKLWGFCMLRSVHMKSVGFSWSNFICTDGAFCFSLGRHAVAVVKISSSFRGARGYRGDGTVMGSFPHVEVGGGSAGLARKGWGAYLHFGWRLGRRCGPFSIPVSFSRGHHPRDGGVRVPNGGGAITKRIRLPNKKLPLKDMEHMDKR